MRMLLITFRYFDLLFRYLAVRSLKPILYIVIISVFASGVYGFGSLMIGIDELFKESWERTGDPAIDIFYGISLLVLARILYLFTLWFERLIDLEKLSREDTNSFKLLDLEKVNSRVYELKKFDHLRRMDIGYFRPKFWFINEETFLKDLKEFKRLVDHYRNKKLRFDETPNHEIDNFLSGNVNNFKSRYASYYDSIFKSHWITNYLPKEIEDYIYQIEGSIEWDEYELSEDKRKTSLKQRILNQKKLIELINDDPRQFIIDYIYRYYCEKYRFYDWSESFEEIDMQIIFELDVDTQIEIDTGFVFDRRYSDNGFKYGYGNTFGSIPTKQTPQAL